MVFFLAQQYVTFPLIKCQTDATGANNSPGGISLFGDSEMSVAGVTGFKMPRGWNGTIMNLSRLELLGEISHYEIENCMRSCEQLFFFL